ncbi:hypothetical protein BCIN_01g10270 [Botrytis cinerea B05.10]|uniref:N-acetylgalactosaminide beta-1,3-galactosyltransferase n=2 Tax=Botryotinia fuckeliana TaxID=40559 RepID=A0A384J6U6_BOTFB|nr:hypothetical protein BCIN_01g10270 [Botrytis cinerea B05.10]ATZ46428.1 hypothetical protein BCIN_01g10270 [Botrytis cinerea B05.10]CCD43072.1 glycosyltransferase family 31 protein [Botrytis cinerea T4]
MALRYPMRSRRYKFLKAIICVAITFILATRIPLPDLTKRRFDTWIWDRSCHKLSPFSKTCTASRASIASDVQIVIETGGSEPQSRLQYQLATIMSEVPRQNILIFSDLEEEVDSFHVHDALADISIRERKNYPEFKFYDELQMYQQLGKDTRELKGGWKLAKYKNMAIKRKIWRMLGETNSALPRRKWYVFIDTDTFVEWDNLLVLLENLDPQKKLYIGSPVWADPKAPFAHGGSAYALSYSALESLNTHDLDGYREPMYSQFGVNTTDLCCGDEALAKALKKIGIRLKGYWPMFNGEVPSTVGFGSEIWCEPVLSLHHLAGTDMEDLWLWIEDWKARTMSMQPFLFKDLFEYIAPQLVPRMNDWENTDEGWKIYHQKGSPVSFSQCKAACVADKLCFQFVSHDSTCALSHTIRLGGKRLPKNEDDHKYISGWNLERIREWTSNTKCTSAHWLHSNP